MDHPEELRNENPEIVVSFLQNISDIFALYGWYILIVAIATAYIYNKYVQTYLNDYMKRKSEDEYAAKYHKDPDLLKSRMTALEEARKKMQDKYNIQVEDFKIKQQLKEEKKRAEWLERHNALPTGIRLGQREKADNDTKKQPLRPEYNPLAGESSGSNYRAPKRSSCAGGGCG